MVATATTSARVSPSPGASPAIGWLRASYTISFGEILPVTYQQIRNNPPLVHYFIVQNPDLREPAARHRPQRSERAHLAHDSFAGYGFALRAPVQPELRAPLGGRLPRAFRLRGQPFLQADERLHHESRASRCRASRLTMDTVDLRRPDPRYYDFKRILNGGIAYLDAAQVSLDIPMRRGLTGDLSYTFGKAHRRGRGLRFHRRQQGPDDRAQPVAIRQPEGQEEDSACSIPLTRCCVTYYYDVPRLAAPGALESMAGEQLADLRRDDDQIRHAADAVRRLGCAGVRERRWRIERPAQHRRSVDSGEDHFGSQHRAADPEPRPIRLHRPGEHRGSLGRGTFRKSPIANFNAALSKQWRWGARAERTVLFRGEAYNLTNHPQFDEPQRNLSAPPFGKITNTLNDGRVFQMGLRLVM